MSTMEFQIGAKVKNEMLGRVGVVTGFYTDAAHVYVDYGSGPKIASTRFLVPNITVRKPAEGWGAGTTQYDTFDQLNKERFPRDRPLDLEKEATWWFAGFLVNHATDAPYHPAVSKNEACDNRPKKIGGGPTRHLLFPNPEYPHLDRELLLFFDKFNGGGVNSKAWYDFMVVNGEIRGEIDVPELFVSAFEKGKLGISLTSSCQIQ